eukprot:scaffold363261_cov47-Attheya_sp.AAC.1
MTHHGTVDYGTVDYGASIMVVVVVVHGTPSNAHSPFLPISRPFIDRSIQRYTIACLPAFGGACHHQRQSVASHRIIHSPLVLA